MPSLTIKELLDTKPHAARVILDYKLGCIGCVFQKFCTLQEVSSIYSIDLKSLLKAIEDQLQ